MAIEPHGPEFNRMPYSPSTGGMVFDHVRSASWIFDDLLTEDFAARLSSPVSTGMHRFFFFFFFFFCGGNEGNASSTVAQLRRRVQDSSKACKRA